MFMILPMFFEHVHLMDCKHFVDVFLPIIVIGYLKEDHFLCFNEKNKTSNVSHNISHFLCPILHKEPFNEIRGTVGNISDWVYEKFHFVTIWGFSRKNVSNCKMHNLPQFCTIWKIKYLYSLLHHKPPKFLNF